jgi:hypothetical protein
VSVRRTAARSLGVLALAGPLAASLLLVSAPAALASGSYTSPTPADGAVLSGNSFTVQVSVAAGSANVTLSVTGRSASGAAFCNASASSNGGALSGAQTLKLSFPASSGACASTRNGTWTAALTGGATGTRSFTTNAAPDTPTGFSARGSGSRDVSFTWTKGAEPDLAGYALYDGSGGVINSDIALSACSGSNCSYGLYYPADNPGAHSYQLASKRASGCSSCGSALESSGRATASATLDDPPPPPPPSPSPSPSTSPDSGGTTGSGTSGGTPAGGSSAGDPPAGGSTGGTPAGGSSTGGTPAGGSSTGGAVKPGPKPTLPTLADPVAASRLAFALRFNAFSPSLGIPKLPPLPSLTLPSIGGEGTLPQGTYKVELPYHPQTVTEKTNGGSFASRPIAAIRELDSAQLAKSLAVALILLLIGAHLRRFLGSHVEE